MTLRAGEDINESDMINESERDATPANDADHLVRLESNGRFSQKFLPFSGAHLTTPSGSTGALGWTAERYDTDSYHDNATNNSRITIPAGASGKYTVTVSLSLSHSQSDAMMSVAIRLNGTTTLAIAGGRLASTVLTGGGSVSITYDFTAGDYVEVVTTSSGGTLTVNSTGSSFTITRLEIS